MTWVVLSASVVGGCESFAQRAGGDGVDYLAKVRAYADALLQEGRDDYGRVHSPLIATTLDRKSMRLFEGEELERIWYIRLKDWENWRIRNRDRCLTGANPMHDENLYQILYALTEVTGDRRYQQEADRTLRWFFRNCQSPSTGLLAWGEHIGWDFRTEYLSKYRKGYHHGGRRQEYNTHEFARPWVLWQRSFELAPKACERFAAGLWDHQIGDQSTGNFSRHANYEIHQPDVNSEYPRHGGFYIATWSWAYKYTGNPLYLKAIEKLVDYFDGRRNPLSDALPAESAPRSKGRILWATSNLSLAIDLWDAAGMVPDELAEKMRRSARRTDRVFLRLAHELQPGGRGFLLSAKTENLEPIAQGAYAGGWDAAGPANLCMVRYRQTGNRGYRRLVLAAGRLYLDSEPATEHALHPGALGRVIYLMLNAYELTGEKRYLRRADYYAKRAVELFFDDGLPLPKATSKHKHYEAVTGADTLMASLLRLWAAANRPDLRLKLVYCDR